MYSNAFENPHVLHSHLICACTPHRDVAFTWVNITKVCASSSLFSQSWRNGTGPRSLRPLRNCGLQVSFTAVASCFFVTAEGTLSGCKDALDWSLKDGCVRCEKLILMLFLFY